MPHDSGYVGRGFSGTKGRSQLRKDVLAKRDSAKKEPEKKAADKPRKAQSVKPSAATKKSVEKRLDKSRSSAQKIRRIQGRVADLRTRAKTAVRGGHKRAASAYRQAAQELLQRIPALRKGK